MEWISRLLHGGDQGFDSPRSREHPHAGTRAVERVFPYVVRGRGTSDPVAEWPKTGGAPLHSGALPSFKQTHGGLVLSGQVEPGVGLRGDRLHARVHDADDVQAAALARQ